MSVLQAAITEDKGLPVWWLRWTQRSRWRRSVSWSFVRLRSPEECELEKIKKDSQRDGGGGDSRFTKGSGKPLRSGDLNSALSTGELKCDSKWDGSKKRTVLHVHFTTRLLTVGSSMTETDKARREEAAVLRSWEQSLLMHHAWAYNRAAQTPLEKITLRPLSSLTGGWSPRPPITSKRAEI